MCLLPYGLHSGTFLATTPSEFVHAFEDWYNSPLLNKGLTYTWSQGGSFRDGVDFVAERAWQAYRAFAIEVDGWTGFFDNQSREDMPGAIVATMCKRLGVDVCFFSSITDYSQEFAYYRAGYPDTDPRVVHLYEEAGWQFINVGELLPFEDPAIYKRRNLKDRMNSDILRCYGDAIGVPLGADVSFGNGIYKFVWKNYNKQ